MRKSPSVMAVLDLLALGTLWILMACLVNPAGNFPLNDDWSYARAVYNLVVNHAFQLTGFTAMPLIAQVVWGASFCLFTGFSFTALRLSTLVLGYVGVAATYVLLKQVQANRAIAIFGALLIAVNPLFFTLSFTFMTDVPFFTFSLLAIIFYLKSLPGKDKEAVDVVALLLGCFFIVMALLIRQLALLIPLAFAATCLLIPRQMTKKRLLLAISPLTLAVVILYGYQTVLRWTIGVPALYNRGFDPILETANGIVQVVVHFLNRMLIAGLYIGLFLLPLTLLFTIQRWIHFDPVLRRSYGLFTSILTLLLTGGLIGTGRVMPLAGNIMFDLGLGPALLRDVYLLGLPHYPRAPGIFWPTVTGISAYGLVLLIGHFGYEGLCFIRKMGVGRWRVNGWPSHSTHGIFGLVATVLFLAFIGVMGYLDRYLLFALPLFMLGLALTALPMNRSVMSIAAIPLLALALFSVAATHDYLSWNRARWNALHQLENAHISHNQIDGGFEYNGWHAYDPAYQQVDGKSFWWVHDDEYLISFGPIGGYSAVRQYPFQRWLPYGNGTIFVLQRTNAKGNLPANQPDQATK